MLLESLREEVSMPTAKLPAAAWLRIPSQRQWHRPLGTEPLVVIKPSGVDYAQLTPANLVVTDLDGKIVEGSLRPSSDLDTHTCFTANSPRSVALFTPL